MHPSYQDQPLYRAWFERFKAFCQKMWRVPASEVESRVTRISLLDLLVIKRPDDLWEMRLPQIQLNLAGFGRTPDEALDALLNLFALHSEYSEAHPLFKVRMGWKDYLKQSLAQEFPTPPPEE